MVAAQAGVRELLLTHIRRDSREDVISEAKAQSSTGPVHAVACDEPGPASRLGPGCVVSKREDGRLDHELRPVIITRGFTETRRIGVESGHTKVLCTASVTEGRPAEAAHEKRTKTRCA